MIKINEIYNANCLELIKDIDDKSIDLIVTDPPYEFISKNPLGGGIYDKKIKYHLDNINKNFGMTFNPTEFLEMTKRIMKIFNLYVFTNKNLLTNYIDFAEQNKYKWDLLIWTKPNPIPAFFGHYMIDKEYCVYMKEPGAPFNSTLDYKKYFSHFNYPIRTKVTKHPTEKPLEFIKKMIEISSVEGSLILDPYLGSGTTLAAARELNRNYIGIEINQEYIEIANNRLSQGNLFS